MSADNIVVIGYRLKLAFEGTALEALMPKFEPNKTFKDKEKIDADLASKRAAWLAEAVQTPYLATFDEVYLSRPKKERVWRGTSIERGKDTGKPPLSVSVANWLLREFPDWSGELVGSGRSPALFIGFNPKLFLKVLGEECSLPGIFKPLPPGMWYGSSDNYRDIEEAIIPGGFEKRLSLETVLKLRWPTSEADAASWERLKTWKEPGVNPQLDGMLATELAGQLGFLRNW